jgi:hypothetical protein
MIDKRYRVYISTPNNIIFLRNRGVRTPVEFENLTKEELGLVEAQIKRHGLKHTVFKYEREITREEMTEEEQAIDILKTVEEEKMKEIIKGEPVVEEEFFDEDIYTVKEEDSVSILNKLLQESE